MAPSGSERHVRVFPGAPLPRRFGLYCLSSSYRIGVHKRYSSESFRHERRESLPLDEENTADAFGNLSNFATRRRASRSLTAAFFVYYEGRDVSRPSAFSLSFDYATLRVAPFRMTNASRRSAFDTKIGGAAGELPPGSGKPDTCFLQAQSRVCLERTGLSRPQSRPPQARLFSDGSRANLTVLAATHVGSGVDCGDLSLTVANLN
jgi:hypothetical protein